MRFAGKLEKSYPHLKDMFLIKLDLLRVVRVEKTVLSRETVIITRKHQSLYKGYEKVTRKTRKSTLPIEL